MATDAPSSPYLKFPFARAGGDKGDQPPEPFQTLLQSCPVSRVEMFDGSHPYMVVKHKDVCDVLADPRLSKERQRAGFPEISAGAKKAAKNRPTFVDMDPPAHGHQRFMVSKFFTPEYIVKRTPFIRETVQHYLDELIKAKGDNESVDLIENFALPVPSHIIYSILGVPDEDFEYLTNCNATRTNGSNTAGAAQSANDELLNYFDQLLDKKLANPGDDLISSLAKEQLEKGNLERKDVVQLSFLILVAGNLTMINTIALGVITLLDHPDQLSQLIENPSLSKSFVEELCRYHTTSSFATRRVAKVDIELGGNIVKAGEGIIASNQAANRDPDVFPDPNAFNMFRERGTEEALGFGWADHRCIAEGLARAELETVFATLFQKLPSLRLAVPKAEIEWTPPTKDVGVTKLPVTW
ncbi:cytochrome P450 [Aspergillus karnatakaensis]|uniref:cytochrome P450 n=1 Tax=Aspergillus karnatakaensis TaxID=1810916 RepID=UPI003CCD1541